MDGFTRAIGGGISGMVAGAFELAGIVLRSMVATLQALLPGALLWVAAFVVLVAIAWTFAKR